MAKRKEGGFALMLVFLMAAVIAITMYKEIPRIAFENQREKEQLLIDRGQQYQRSIQVFMKDNKRWPAKIEELESFNNKRYLRKRFRDPMTGKDEWRVIHIANGVLQDSLVTKPPSPTDQKSTDTFKYGGPSVDAQAGLGQTPVGGAQNGVNLANRRRASEGGQVPGVGGGMNGPDLPPDNSQNPQNLQNQPNGQNPLNGQNPQNPGDPNALGATGVPPQTGATNPQGTAVPPGVPGMPRIPGMPGGMPQPVMNPAQPGQVSAPGQVGTQQFVYNSGMGQQQSQTTVYPTPGQTPTPYQPGVYQPPVNSQTGGVSPYNTMPGANGVPPNYGQPGSAINPQQMGNQAQQMIQQILTSPRPGGAPVAAGGMAGAMGAGIAGFASSVDSDSIKVYNEHTNYKEWEFVFDPAKMKPIPNPLAGANGTPAGQLGSMPGNTIGTPASQLGSGFGSQPGGQSSFGSQPGGQSPFGSSPQSPMSPIMGPRQQQ